MSQKESKRIFNLLKPIEIPKTIWDKVYDWLVGKAKIIILVTQVIVALCFFAKVYVDTSAKAKEKKIERFENEIGFYSRDNEPLFRRIHRKDTEYKKIWQRGSNTAYITREIYSYNSNPASEITVKIEGSRVTVFGNDDLDYLRTLEGAMKNSRTFKEAFVTDLTQEQTDILEGVGRYIIIATISDDYLYRESLQ